MYLVCVTLVVDLPLENKILYLEVHLFDDKIDDIYGSLIYVEFLEKIRDEVKFPSTND